MGLSAVSAQGRGQAAQSGREPLDRSLRMMIAAMDPGTYTEKPRFAGTASTLEFTTELPMAAGPPQRADVQIALESGRLVLRWAPRDHAEIFSARAAAPRTEILLDDIDGVRFAYTANAAGPWSSDWHDADLLPRLIRIDVSRGGHEAAPPILASPLRDRPDQ